MENLSEDSFTDLKELDPQQLKKLTETLKFISHNQTLTKQLIKNLMKENYNNEDYWKHVLEVIKLDNEFIYNNIKSINLQYLLKYQKLDNTLFTTYFEITDRINNEDLWEYLFKYQPLDSNILNTLLLKYSPFDTNVWDIISKHQYLNTDIYELYGDLLNWNLITMYQSLTFDQFSTYLDKLNINLLHYNIVLNNYISDNTITLLNKKLYDNIGYFDNISDDFIIENIAKLSYNGIISALENRDLELDTIYSIVNSYPDKLDILIPIICDNQQIDDNFIVKYNDRIDWNKLSENLPWSVELLDKYYDKIDFEALSRNIYIKDDWCDKLDYLANENKIDSIIVDNFVKNYNGY